MATHRKPTHALLLSGAVLTMAGCTRALPPVLGGAHLADVAVSVDPPGQIAVLVSAEASREPLRDMTASSFRVYENGVLLDPSTTGQTLLLPAVVTSFHTMLMVDASAGLSPEQRARLAQAVASFVSTLQPEQSVTAYAFDGSPTPTLIGDFPQGDQPATAALDTLAHLEPKDASRDLRGALVSGLEELNARMMQVRKPLRIGTLVIVARGGDLAKRVSDDRYYGSIDATQRDVFVVAVGEATPELRRLGKSGYIEAATLDDLGPALEHAAARSRGVVARHYLLSYCSPARSGTARAHIEARTVDANGRERIGRFSLEYDASQFGPGCDPQRIPSFGVRSETPAPAAPAGAPSAGTPASAAPADAPSAETAAPDAAAPAAKPAPAPAGPDGG